MAGADAIDMKKDVAVVDYGAGNIHSIDKALNYVSPDDNIAVVSDPQAVADADRVVFPGVGAIGDCIAALQEQGLDEAIRKAAQEKPLLAICVGMQALFGANEESGGGLGLSILDGEVKRLPNKTEGGGMGGMGGMERMGGMEVIKVPQMGWNQVMLADKMLSHPLFDKVAQGTRFYFVHSYYCLAEDSRISAAKCDYGLEFDAAVVSGNIFATQFHPEKSHTDGLQLLRNFFQWDGTEVS